ncbi:MAG TPA: trimethylamine methyltransferase family protein [Steroidobacteraceae bacterium]|nr:trimethylamine methyltransferase family protein [Steroidobacteraceae bacterium]
MSEPESIVVRRGARAARHAARAAPLPENLRPVIPGMPGGLYKPLADADVLRIHRAALDVLEQIGLADATPSGVEYMTRAGAELNARGRLVFPRALVEDTLAHAGRRFVLHGQEAKHDMEPWGSRVYFGTAGAAVHIVDGTTGAYRDSTTKDLYDIARVVDTLEHLHFYQRSIVCRELTSPLELDINTAYACVAGTTKHVGTSWVRPEHVAASLEMLHMIAGGEDKWRARPFVSQSNCFVVPPLKFAYDACLCLETAVKGGMPVLLLSAGQAGATAPAALAAALVQEVAECLAGLVYVNAIKPGAPAIFGTWCFVSDLRTGAMSGGSPEQALLSAASAQLARYYDLTGGTASGMSDAKLPDVQSGYEKAYNHALVGNAGANLIYESAGMLASLLGFSMESLIIDNDIIGAVQRTIKGIDVSDESLSLETIRKVCLEGPGHYLGADQTLQRMQKEYVYPCVGDRSSPNEWQIQGRPTVIERAVRKLHGILESHYPTHIPAAVDEAIRARLPIRLPRESMRPAGR